VLNCGSANYTSQVPFPYSPEEFDMYARNVSISLKPNTAREFTQTFENDILPLLRKQNGFKDEITFLGEDGQDVVAISLWDRKESADAYSRETYPQVLKGLSKVVSGTPEVHAYEVSNSTFHKIAAKV
jgi:heme-degrading monooxygenase HmoA